MAWLKFFAFLLTGLSSDRKNLVIVLLAFGVLGTVGVQYVNNRHTEALNFIGTVKADTLREVVSHETRYAESLRSLTLSIERLDKRQWDLLLEVKGMRKDLRGN